MNPHNHEAVKRRDHEQIHGGNVRREGPLPLAGWPSSLDHVLGDARLRDLEPELEQFAVDAWRPPKLVLRAHQPDQHAQFHIDSRAPSPRVRFPTPTATKAGPMPPHQRFRLDNRYDHQDRWKPSIHRNEEPAIVVGRLSATPHPAPQDDQLVSEHRILRLKPALRLERRGQPSLATAFLTRSRIDFAARLHRLLYRRKSCAVACRTFLLSQVCGWLLRRGLFHCIR
jgi:hypothetical protein